MSVTLLNVFARDNQRYHQKAECGHEDSRLEVLVEAVEIRLRIDSRAEQIVAVGEDSGGGLEARAEAEKVL